MNSQEVMIGLGLAALAVVVFYPGEGLSSLKAAFLTKKNVRRAAKTYANGGADPGMITKLRAIIIERGVTPITNGDSGDPKTEIALLEDQIRTMDNVLNKPVEIAAREVAGRSRDIGCIVRQLKEVQSYRGTLAKPDLDDD